MPFPSEDDAQARFGKKFRDRLRDADTGLVH